MLVPGPRCLGLAGLAAALLLVACAGPRGLESAPRITIVSLEPVQVELLEQRYVATVRVQNPNPVALPISGLDYSITINGADFASGVSSQRVTVPAFGEKTLDLGMTSTFARLFEQLRRFARSDGRVEYAISGSVGLQDRLTTVPFEQKGEIDLRLEPRRRDRAA